MALVRQVRVATSVISFGAIMSRAIQKGVPSCLCLCVMFLVLIATFESGAAERSVATLAGKHIVGYQGWFSCPGDISGLGWGHWFRSSSPSTSSLAIDMWPDTSGFDQDELCPTALRLPSGAPANLFSSENPKTVARHFRWLRDYGIDAVALQRFESGMTKPAVMTRANNVLRNVTAAAAATVRGFFIMYDLTGADLGCC